MAPNASRRHATAVLLDDEQDMPRSATGPLFHASAALATTFNQGQPLAVPGRFWAASVVAGDVLGAAATVLCLPLVILAIGIPIALCVRLLLWIAGLL